MADPNAQEPSGEIMADFLKEDFSQCFSQMRHYDGQIIDICKFAFGAYTTAVGASLALYKYGVEKNIDYSPSAEAILAIACSLGLVMLSLVVRNRVYFVVVTRYVNELRAHFLSCKPTGFANLTGMYTRFDQPPYFDWRSSQSLLLYTMAILNTSLFGVLLFLLSPVIFSPPFLGFLCILTLAAQISISIFYLKGREAKTAPHAVFGQN